MKHTKNTKILIIGAGPAGIATAVEARKYGFRKDQIIILEKSSRIVQMIADKYPDEKLVLANYKGVEAANEGGLHIDDMTKKEFLNYMDGLVEKFELDIRFNQSAHKISKLRTGQFSVETATDSFLTDAVFVAIGNMSSPKALGADLDEASLHKIYTDIQNLSLSSKKVLVVGGGDSAAEYAKILSDRGHQVVMSYRGNQFVRMIEANATATMKLIEEGKIDYLPNSELGNVRSSGDTLKVTFKVGPYAPLEVDTIVAAIGNDRPTQYLASIGITLVEADAIGESPCAGLYFLGDLSAGKKGGSINYAFNSAYKAFKHAQYYYLD